MRPGKRIKVTADPVFCVLLAALFLMLPLQWALAVLLAAGFHEACHILAMGCCGVDVFSLQLSLRGAYIRAEPMKPMQELLCAAAGPAGGILLVLLGRWMPLLAICGAFQTLFNLLPFYPLDGGRILRCFLQSVLSAPIAQRVERVITGLVIASAWILGVYATVVLKLGVAPVAIAWILAMQAKKNKNTLQS